MPKMIRGCWETGQVWIDDEELLPDQSLKLVNHSPTGFSWGYGGLVPHSSPSLSSYTYLVIRNCR